MAHVINDLENVLSAANRHEDSTVKVSEIAHSRQNAIMFYLSEFLAFIVLN